MKTIGIIALSGDVDADKLQEAVTNIKQLGVDVKLSENILDKNRYLAGSDEHKLEALYKMFQDPEIDIIMPARGGYGAIRLVNQIDYSIIKNNSKVFCGFSDVTALLLMIYKKTGLVTYHGPMAVTDFSYPSPKSKISTLPQGESIARFLDVINGKSLEFSGDKIYRQGEAKGILWGGNLATVVSLCGLDFLPDKDFIFFAEDLNEPVYKIDKMFQQLINLSEFRGKCKGIILGDFLNVDNEIWLEEYFQELADRLQIPVVGGFKITHNEDKISIPIGKKGSLLENKLTI